MIKDQDLLAKLLAGENITVVYRKVKTASFYPDTRVLELPVFSYDNDSVHKMFVGHEVGHALYTPNVDTVGVEGYVQIVNDPKNRAEYGTALGSFLNVIEDVRIEKLFQRKYPGFRKFFIEAYRQLMADGWFASGDADVCNATMSLIDRINVHFKAGPSFGIQFTDDEQQYVDRASEIVAWDDAVELAKELCAKAKKEFIDKMRETADDAPEQGDDGDVQYQAPEDEEFPDDQEQSADFGEMPDDLESKDDPDSGENHESDTGDDADDSDETNDDSDETNDDSDETNDDSDETNDDSDPADDAVDMDSDGSDELDDDQDSGEALELDGSDEGAVDGTGDDFDIAESDIAESDDEGNIDGNELSDEEIAEAIGSQTDDDLRNSLEEIFQEASTAPGSIHNLVLPKSMNFEKVILTNEEILKNHTHDTPAMLRSGERQRTKFMKKNSRIIKYMIKQFNMRKAAQSYARETTSKSGQLDTLKMNQYQMTDDIFRKLSVVQEGKNHGLLMFVDWSGSMQDDLPAVMEQIVCMVLFCRGVDIPFRVYGFSQPRKRDHSNEVRPSGEIDVNGLTLIEIFNSDAKKSKFVDQVRTAFCLANKRSRNRYFCRYTLRLTLTYLQKALLAANYVFDDLKASYGLDVVNTVFLTDGCDTDGFEFSTVSGYSSVSRRGTCDYKDEIFIRDTKTSRTVNSKPIGDSWGSDRTDVLVELLKAHTNSNVIGYHVSCMVNNANSHTSHNSKTFIGVDELSKLNVSLRAEGWVEIPSVFDLHLTISNGKRLNTANTTLSVSQDADLEDVQQAFTQLNSSKKSTRKMLDQFIELIA